MSPTNTIDHIIQTTDLSTDAAKSSEPAEPTPAKKETYREIMARMKKSKKSEAEKSESIPIRSIGGGQFTKIDKI